MKYIFAILSVAFVTDWAVQGNEMAAIFAFLFFFATVCMLKD